MRRPAGGHLLLLLDERLLALRLAEARLVPRAALARSVFALLVGVLALPALLAAWARPGFAGDDILDGEEEELRIAIACSFGRFE
jgi:hypothetical protein